MDDGSIPSCYKSLFVRIIIIIDVMGYQLQVTFLCERSLICLNQFTYVI